MEDQITVHLKAKEELEREALVQEAMINFHEGKISLYDYIKVYYGNKSITNHSFRTIQCGNVEVLFTNQLK